MARAIDADLTPRSRPLDGVSLAYREDLAKARRTVSNVVGILRGSGPAAGNEAIVLGAHYDHLGTSGRFSLAQGGSGQIHNGADDNASGTAAVIEIASLAAGAPARAPRSLVFVAFAGEELGLLGSRHYLDHAPFPPEDTVAMINLDMVGRSNGRILVSGLDTAPGLAASLEAAGAAVPLTVSPTGAGSASAGASDHLSFELRQIPSIFFFSGLHADYHRPTDDWEKGTRRAARPSPRSPTRSRGSSPAGPTAWRSCPAPPRRARRRRPPRAAATGPTSVRYPILPRATRRA